MSSGEATHFLPSGGRLQGQLGCLARRLLLGKGHWTVWFPMGAVGTSSWCTQAAVDTKSEVWPCQSYRTYTGNWGSVINGLPGATPPVEEESGFKPRSL